MSLERFRTEYNIPNLRQVLLSEKERKFPEKSLAGYLGMRFAEFGAEGLRETEADISSKEKAYHVNVSAPYPVSQSDQYKLGDNYSAIVVGTVIELMADAADKGVFNKPEYVNANNFRVRDSKLYSRSRLYSGPLEVQVIKNDKWEELRRLAEENPTLTALFTTGWHLMPDFIQWHIGQGGDIELIKRRVIPTYHSVALKAVTSS